MTGAFYTVSEANILSDMAGGVIGKLRYNATVAELVISLLTGSGASVTNQQWLSQLNSSYGVSSTIANATGTDGTIGQMMDAGLFSIGDDGTFIDNGLMAAIESQPAYTSCDINNIMGTWNEAGDTITTKASENLGASIGAGALLGTISQVAGSFSLGFNLGNLAQNLVKQWGQKMKYGAFINSSANLDNVEVPNGYDVSWVRFTSETGSESDIVFSSPGLRNILIVYPYQSNSGIMYVSINNSNNVLSYIRGRSNSYINFINPNYNGRLGSNSAAQHIGKVGILGYEQAGCSILTVNNLSEANTLVSNLATGSTPLPEIKPIVSPDIIGPEGNQQGTSFSNPSDLTNWPDINNSQPEGKGISIIPWSDYTDFVDQANENTNNGDTGQIQGSDFVNFTNPYWVTPEETKPTPDYNEQIPSQPTINTLPTLPDDTDIGERPEEFSSELTNTGPFLLPDLMDRFPFCIPKDILAIFQKFTSAREAPRITFTLKSDLFNYSYDVDIDFSPYDDVASLFRTLELIGFILGLALATRALIRG